MKVVLCILKHVFTLYDSVFQDGKRNGSSVWEHLLFSIGSQFSFGRLKTTCNNSSSIVDTFGLCRHLSCTYSHGDTIIYTIKNNKIKLCFYFVLFVGIGFLWLSLNSFCNPDLAYRDQPVFASTMLGICTTNSWLKLNSWK